MPGQKSTTNGSLKFVGMGTVVAICCAVVAYGEFKGDVKANVKVNTEAIATRKLETDTTHTRIWERIGVMQEQYNETQISVSKALGRIEGTLESIEKHIHRGE